VIGGLTLLLPPKEKTRGWVKNYEIIIYDWGNNIHEVAISRYLGYQGFDKVICLHFPMGNPTEMGNL
jgi:hypothetical protein